MYTATVISTRKEQGNIKAVISFSNGTDVIEREFTVNSAEDLRVSVRNEKNRLDGVASSTVTSGVLDLSDPVTPTLTQAELDKVAWFRIYRRWVTIKTTLIDTGILLGTETPVVNLKAQVQSGFKPAYLNDLG